MVERQDLVESYEYKGEKMTFFPKVPHYMAQAFAEIAIEYRENKRKQDLEKDQPPAPKLEPEAKLAKQRADFKAHLESGAARHVMDLAAIEYMKHSLEYFTVCANILKATADIKKRQEQLTPKLEQQHKAQIEYIIRWSKIYEELEQV